MDEKHVERLRALLADLDHEGVRATSTVLDGYRSRLRAILHDAATESREPPYAGTTSYSEREKIVKLIDYVANDLQRQGLTTGPRSYEKAREMVDAVRRLPHPDRADPGPDVVTANEVNDLPEGSLVVACEKDGTPLTETRTKKIRTDSRNRLGLHSHYRVIDRAPEFPVKVGDVITGKRANDLPDGSIIRHARGDSSSSSSYPLTKRNGEWRTSAMGPAHEPHRSSSQFRVLDLGGN